jgi:hypothetical protein
VAVTNSPGTHDRQRVVEGRAEVVDVVQRMHEVHQVDGVAGVVVGELADP